MAAILLLWCDSFDQQEYAPYLSVYYAEMTQLVQKHPDVHMTFQDGWFPVQLGSDNPFGRFPVYQTKDTETASRYQSLKPTNWCY